MLEAKVDNFNVEELLQSEVFSSTLIQATRAAIRTHSEEKHKQLRNAVLNSVLLTSPEENRQSIFVQLCDELSDVHIHILKVFEEKQIPSIDLDNPKWKQDSYLSRLANVIEAAYLQLQGQFNTYVHVIADLRRRGLITNLIPEKDMTTELHHSPTLSIVAADFLAFLKSPLGDN